MLTFKELLSGHLINDLSISDQHNLEELLAKMNVIREAWGKPMLITSGYRSMQDHLRIYAAKGITDPKKIPMKSHHLFGEACDISDPNLELTAWLKTGIGENLAEELGLYFEEGNKNWVHAQIVPPKSGKRWFQP